ncbi:hypothetical protein L6R53_04045 [Myxococcota bacterium]|nr:hypothetical protein [Myxococcota bacterium]
MRLSPLSLIPLLGLLLTGCFGKDSGDDDDDDGGDGGGGGWDIGTDTGTAGDGGGTDPDGGTDGGGAGDGGTDGGGAGDGGTDGGGAGGGGDGGGGDGGGGDGGGGDGGGGDGGGGDGGGGDGGSEIDALSVELTWEHSGDDLDLHLLAPGADTGDLETDLDCYYVNCTTGLDWGAAGESGNPILVEDDIAGTGPEQIDVALPEDGVYTVVVHDYPGSVYSSANEATVVILVGGRVEGEALIEVTEEDEYILAAQVVYRDGVFVEVSGF